MLPVRTILHATDFSESSGAAFRLACSLATDYGARLVILHVEPPPVAIYAMEAGAFIEPDNRAELLTQLHALKPTDPSIAVEYRLVQGDAAAEILNTAKECKCDVLVLGTHGRKGLGRLLLGSVAEQVIREAPCPVLTKRPMARQEVPAEHPAREVAEEELDTVHA